MNVEILYEDAHIFVVVKPAGMPSQSERSASMDMVSYLKNLLARRDKVKNPYVAVVHRLDRPVGGVMVYAKTPKAAADLSAQICERSISKAYTAVLSGLIEPNEGMLTDWLIKDGKTNSSRVADGDISSEAKKAVLRYKVLSKKQWDEQMYCLVHIQLETGRHHQIRVQMAHAGTPIVGDTKYGKVDDSTRRFRNVALFSSALEFEHPVTKKKMQFSAKPSGDAFQMFDCI